MSQRNCIDREPKLDGAEIERETNSGTYKLLYSPDYSLDYNVVLSANVLFRPNYPEL